MVGTRTEGGIVKERTPQIGDTVTLRGRHKPTPRDWMVVTRIDRDGLYGYRNVPEPWERNIEFWITDSQRNSLVIAGVPE